MKRKRNRESAEPAERVEFQQALGDDPDSADGKIVRAVRHLPDPGPAMVAGMVMSRIRRKQSDTIRIRVRDIAWGLAGGFAGVILGLWIAGSAPDTAQIAARSGYDAEFTELADDIDLLAWDLSSDSGVTP
ncbi:MAG TPA: hypothetical protein ENL08_05305 [Bacteroidetes bacterium]|nr:hypothetical protein [Bacteroidota bacterium]